MNDLAEHRRKNPADDPPPRWSTPRSARTCWPGRARALLHPPGGGGQRHDPHGHHPRHEPAGAEPRPAGGLAGRPRRRDPARRRGDRAGRVAGHVHAAHPHPRPDLVSHDFVEGDKVVLFYGAANRNPGSSTIPSGSTSAAAPTTTSASAAPGPTSAWGPTSPAARWRWRSASCSRGCRTSRSPPTRCRSEASASRCRRDQAPAGEVHPHGAHRVGSLTWPGPPPSTSSSSTRSPSCSPPSSPSTRTGGRATSSTCTTRRAGRRRVLHDGPLPGPRAHGLAADGPGGGEPLIGLHDRAYDGDPHTTDVPAPGSRWSARARRSACAPIPRRRPSGST